MADYIYDPTMEGRSVVQEYESMHPEDVPAPIRAEANRLLAMTTAAQGGRMFIDRSQFGECLRFLAVLTDDPRWDFLRGG